MKTIIVACSHLGSFGSEQTTFLNFLKQVDADLLVLNGDIYDLYVSSPKVNIFSIIKMNTKIKDWIYIVGNHDSEIRSFFPEYNDKILAGYENEHIVIIHGSQFDDGLNENTEMIVKVRNKLEFFLGINLKKVARFFFWWYIDSLMSIIQKKAKCHYPNKKVIIGHTHIPMNDNKNGDFNCGSMVDGMKSFIEINDGKIILHQL